MTGHRMRWFGRCEPDAQYPDGFVPRNSMMRARDWGWDVRCSCGWASRTGGGTRATVLRLVVDHMDNAMREDVR